MTDETLLHRQVHPAWIQHGHVTSQVFRPTPKDEKCLSTYDGDQISAENAWKHFTEVLRFRSAGVMAITVQECSIQGLPVRPDPEPFPEHVVIDFNGLAEGQIKRAAKHLKAAAETRGWIYQADNGADPAY